jgi:hypothetical protein
MINRNDLAKQFELVVQQEIKNHNESLLATNLSINEFRKDLDELKNHQGLVNASFSYEISKINQSKLELSEVLLKISQKLDSHINDTKILIERSHQDQQILIEDFDKFIKETESLEERLIKSESEQSKIKDLMKELGKAVSAEMDQWNKKFNDDLKKTKNEILNLPSEAQAVKKELENKLESSAIDCEGLVREVLVCKKAAFIIEKKIENLYTLIERLDQRVSS